MGILNGENRYYAGEYGIQHSQAAFGVKHPTLKSELSCLRVPIGPMAWSMMSIARFQCEAKAAITLAAARRMAGELLGVIRSSNTDNPVSMACSIHSSSTTL